MTALRANEIGADGSPYALSFAGKGDSGASVGVLQTDLSTNPAALNAIWKVLLAAGQSAAWASKVCAPLSKPQRCNPLNVEDLLMVNEALKSAYARQVIDQLDALAMRALLGRMGIITNEFKLTIAAQCALACWVNMTGLPTRMLAWMRAGNAAETPVTLTVMLDYLAATQYFSQNPRNFEHFKQSLPPEDFSC